MNHKKSNFQDEFLERRRFIERDQMIDITDAVGCTPMLRLNFRPENVTIFAKCEFLNPSGSIKDRLAKAIISDAEERGLLLRDSTILECSSGNTGVAFAMLGAAKGYKVTIVISEHASRERLQLIEQLGARVITFPESGYLAGINLTRKMAESDPRYFLPRQFENPLNAWDHEQFTGQEIMAQIPGQIDAFVNGYGTGGTLAGVSRALRRKFPEVGIYAMEPAEAAALNGEAPCCHLIEGVADGFVPALLDGVHLNGAIKVTSQDAIKMARRLTREFGLLVGTSSGANVTAAIQIAGQLQRPSPVVVTLLCDRAERYFSTPLFPALLQPVSREQFPFRPIN
jgi:cysteine synthase